MKSKYDSYNISNESGNLDSKINLAKEMVDEFNKNEKVIEDDPNILKDIIDMDLRENVPPQIYEVISCIVDLIVKAEDK